MRVAGDDDVDAGAGGVAIELLEIVQDVDARVGRVERGGCGKGGGPGTFVDIAADGGDGREGAEAVEDGGIADVAGVDDVIGTGERGEGFGTEQAVGVGDDSDHFDTIWRL